MPSGFGTTKQVVEIPGTPYVPSGNYMQFRGDYGITVQSTGAMSWLSTTPLNAYNLYGGGWVQCGDGYGNRQFQWEQGGPLLIVPSNSLGPNGSGVSYYSGPTHTTVELGGQGGTGLAPPNFSSSFGYTSECPAGGLQLGQSSFGSSSSTDFPSYETFFNSLQEVIFLVACFDPLATNGILWDMGASGVTMRVNINPCTGISQIEITDTNNPIVVETEPSNGVYWCCQATGQEQFVNTSTIVNTNMGANPAGVLTLYTVIVDRTQPAGRHISLRINGADIPYASYNISGHTSPPFGNFLSSSIALPEGMGIGFSLTSNPTLMNYYVGQASPAFDCLPISANSGQLGEFRWYNYIPNIASVEADINSFWGLF